MMTTMKILAQLAPTTRHELAPLRTAPIIPLAAVSHLSRRLG